MSEGEYIRERNELRAQISNLLEQMPSLSALRAAQYILQASIPPSGRVIVVLRDMAADICCYLSFKESISFSQVCKDTRSWRQRLVLRQINTLLRPLVSDPGKLIALMRQTNSVISGSSVLWLLEGFPSSWSAGDLDMYCPVGARTMLVTYFQNEGYHPLHDAPTSKFHGALLASTTKMKKGNLGVDILESETESSIDPIMMFHTTLVMNYITWKELVILYPSFTFQKVGIIQDNQKRGDPAWKQKYTNRGYNITPYPPPNTLSTHLVCPKQPRHCHDKDTLTICFDLLDNAMPSSLGSWRFSGGVTRHSPCTRHRCIVAELHKGVPSACVELTMRKIYSDILEVVKPTGKTFNEDWLRTRVFQTALFLINAAQGGKPISFSACYVLPHLDLSYLETCGSIKDISANGDVVLWR